MNSGYIILNKLGLHSYKWIDVELIRLLSSLLLDPGMAARDVAQALKSLASAARGVAATTVDSPARNAMLDCAGDVMDKSANLIEETKRAIAKPGDAESQQRLAQVRYSLRDREGVGRGGWSFRHW